MTLWHLTYILKVIQEYEIQLKIIKLWQATPIDGRWDALYGNNKIGQIAQGGSLAFLIWD